MIDDSTSKPLLCNAGAESASSDLPAFLARPVGAPVYHGFPIVPESAIDGWCFGAITDYADPDGCEFGDAFVVAPDGSRAGLVWQVGEGTTEEVQPPESERWGVYTVWFARPIHTTAEWVAAFHAILPELRVIHARAATHAARIH